MRRGDSEKLSSGGTVAAYGGACVGLVLASVIRLTPLHGLEPEITLILVAVVAALLWQLLRRTGQSDSAVMNTALALARDSEVFDVYQGIGKHLQNVSWRNDPIFREVALGRISKLSTELGQISEGVISFQGTETWRLVYETLLRSRGLFLYRSVSWINTDRYWQDEPGRQSLRLNLELHESEQLKVERIAIVADEYWPVDEPLPASRIRQWIHEQHVAGIWIKLVRQSQLAGETDLVADIGIYGTRAVGHQTLDDTGRTVKFKLNFNMDQILQAEERWKRLDVYATAYGDLLDQFSIDD